MYTYYVNNHLLFKYAKNVNKIKELKNIVYKCHLKYQIVGIYIWYSTTFI